MVPPVPSAEKTRQGYEPPRSRSVPHISMAWPIRPRLLKQTRRCERAFVLASTGSAMAASTASTASIAANSRRVNPRASMRAQIRGGKVRAIGLASRERNPAVPDVPTMAELGIPDFDVGTWSGLVGPKGMPADVVQKINAAVARWSTTPRSRSACWTKAPRSASRPRPTSAASCAPRTRAG